MTYECCLCFCSVHSKKKCSVLHYLLMGKVELRVHTDTQQQAPLSRRPSSPCGGGATAFEVQKELDLADRNCTCCIDDEDIVSQKLWQLLSLSTIQEHLKQTQMKIPLEHVKSTQMQSLSHHHKCALVGGTLPDRSSSARLQWPLNPPKPWHPKKMGHQ